jgi:signal transduction histidine kinase
MARVVADHAVGPLAFGDRVEADRILSRLSIHPGIEAAVLYDGQGRVFARFRDLPLDAPPPDAGPSRVFVGDHLHVFEPVAHEGETYGALRLVASTSGLRAKMWRQLLILAVAGGLLVLLSLAFAWRLQRALSDPILRLTETVRWISAAHDYSVRVPKAGSDEVGVLCDGFNEMLGELGRKNTELRDKGALIEELFKQERQVSRTLEELNEMKTSFLVVTSHELRTPLTVIKGYNEALLGGVLGRLGEQQRKALEACERMLHRLVEVVGKIQQMLDAGQGPGRAPLGSVELRGLAGEVMAELEPFVAQRRQTLLLEAPEAVHVPAQRDKLEYVLVGLLQNAVKFTGDEGEVRLSIAREADSVRITVADTGIGIEPADLERIFESFFTSTDTLHHRSGHFQFGARGAGLGLAIARRYVEAHGGRIWAESEGRGQGSRFQVVLPLVRRRDTGPVPRPQ